MHSKNYGTALLQILMIVGLTILPVNAHEVEVSYVPQDYELKTFHTEYRQFHSLVQAAVQTAFFHRNAMQRK